MNKLNIFFNIFKVAPCSCSFVHLVRTALVMPQRKARSLTKIRSGNHLPCIVIAPFIPFRDISKGALRNLLRRFRLPSSNLHPCLLFLAEIIHYSTYRSWLCSVPHT